MHVPENEQPSVGRPVELSDNEGKTWRHDVLTVYDNADHSLRCEGNRWYFFHEDPAVPRADKFHRWRYIEMEF